MTSFSDDTFELTGAVSDDTFELTGAVSEAIFEAIAFWVSLECSGLTCFGSFFGRAARVALFCGGLLEGIWMPGMGRPVRARFLRWGRADKSPDNGRLSSEDKPALLGDGCVPTV
jgi:hypothetical protein